jgi:uncharacterized damage-inducible protein DinB
MEVNMQDHYKMFAAYNQWANQKLYSVAQTLTEKEIHRDTGAFFHSLFGTLTHLLVADSIWLNRFSGSGPVYSALDARPFPDIITLTQARQMIDSRFIDYVETLSNDSLEQMISYTRSTDPTPQSHRLGPALTHVFNHQTHHRGQAHMILTVLGKPSLPMDLIYFLREKGQHWL